MNVYVVRVSEPDCAPYVHIHSVEGYCLEFAGKTDGCCMPVSFKRAWGTQTLTFALERKKRSNVHYSHSRMLRFYQMWFVTIKVHSDVRADLRGTDCLKEPIKPHLVG